MAAGSEEGTQHTGAVVPHAGGDDPRSRAERRPQGGTVEQAKEACLRLLAVRARSRAELAQRLAAKGFTPEITERALDRFTEVGLIDDAAFAEQWVHSRHTFSGKGKQALAQELRRKGVSQSDAASALEAITADDEEQRATELVRRKLRTMPANLDRDKTIRRLVAMLARRGYNQSTAFTVVKAELAQAQFDAGDPE
ncbi:recombination regulator RecX [Nocardia sp. CA-135398]|uniref:recombination regulator RecX n=1 Tax=Nocardia sp. CA-135398 TaxID=3239977 RepID=UPI003D9578E6